MSDPVYAANVAFNNGEELISNPYPKGSDDYDAYMMQMAKRQLEEHQLFTKKLQEK